MSWTYTGKTGRGSSEKKDLSKVNNIHDVVNALAGKSYALAGKSYSPGSFLYRKSVRMVTILRAKDKRNMSQSNVRWDLQILKRSPIIIFIRLGKVSLNRSCFLK